MEEQPALRLASELLGGTWMPGQDGETFSLIERSGLVYPIDENDVPIVEPYMTEILRRPQDALDIHLSQWSWSRTTEALDRAMAFFRAYEAGKGGGLLDMAEVQSEALAVAIEDAKTVYVSPDVAEVVAQMGESMPPDMLMPSDLPSPGGLAILGIPWQYQDFDVDEYIGVIPVRAILWKAQDIIQPDKKSFRPGVMIGLYADTSWAEHCIGADKKLGGPLYLVDLWAWTYENWWEEVGPEDETDQHHARSHVGHMRRKLLALWRFMQEEIVVTSREQVSRPAQRRWARTKVEIPEDGGISVLHLRRKESVGSSGSTTTTEHHKVNWSHRWWVRGNWARNPKTGMKTTWRRPHLKGPEGLPIVVKPQVISVDR